MNKAIKLCCILLVIVLAAAAGWWGTRPYLYMEASGVIITAVPAKADLPFDIKFIHSVQKTPVEEYLVVGKAAEDIVLQSTRYRSFGVGLPFIESDGSFRPEGDYFIMDNMDRHFPNLSLRTGIGTKLTVTIDGSEYRLYESYAPGSRIDIYIAPHYRMFKYLW